MPWTSLIAKALSGYSTWSSSCTSANFADHHGIHASRTKCASFSVSVTISSTCVSSQKDPQILMQYVWAFPPILRNWLPRSQSWQTYPTQWYTHFNLPSLQLQSISKPVRVFTRRMVLEWWWKEIPVELPKSHQDSWTPGGCCSEELATYWCTAKWRIQGIE